MTVLTISVGDLERARTPMPQAAVKRIDPAWKTRETYSPNPGLGQAKPGPGTPSGGFPADARGLQASLHKRITAESTRAPRWSARRTLAFMLVSSLALWGLIIWGGLEVAARLAG